MSCWSKKLQLTSGSTCHAAGLVTQFNPSPAMMQFRRYSVELYERLGVFDRRWASLRIASSPEGAWWSWERGASRARGIGLEGVRAVAGRGAGADATGREPGRSVRRRSGYEQDGWSTRTRPRTRWPTQPVSWGRGWVLQNTRVTGIELDDRRGGVRAVADRGGGRIAAEHVVNACGIWAPAGVGHGGGVHAVGAGRPPAHRTRRRWTGHELPRGACPASEHRQTSSTAAPRRAGCCSAATSRTRSHAGWTGCRGTTPGRTCRPTSSGSPSSGAARRGGFRSSRTRAWSRWSATRTR